MSLQLPYLKVSLQYLLFYFIFYSKTGKNKLYINLFFYSSLNSQSFRRKANWKFSLSLSHSLFLFSRALMNLFTFFFCCCKIKINCLSFFSFYIFFYHARACIRSVCHGNLKLIINSAVRALTPVESREHKYCLCDFN